MDRILVRKRMRDEAVQGIGCWLVIFFAVAVLIFLLMRK
jgi:hypothetical protein